MVTDERLCKGTLSDSNATLYTVPTGTKTIVKSLSLCNTTGAAVTATLKLAGTEIYSVSVGANSTIHVQSLDQIIEAGELIEGSASVASAVKYYMSGKEIIT